MSWIRRNPLLALTALALAARLACAAATQVAPIFPSYYYTDATLTHSDAVAALADVQAGRKPVVHGSLGRSLQTWLSLWVYRLVGARPLAVKLLNCLLGALAVAAFTRAAAAVFAPRSALAAGVVLAAWPSHVFYTSQNLKEAPVALLAYAAFGAALAAGVERDVPRGRAALLAAASAACLLGAGFYRLSVMLALAAALLAALAFAARRTPRANALLAAAAVLGALAAYPGASRRLLSALSTEPAAPAWAGALPSAAPAAGAFTPAGISRLRRERQEADRVWAAQQAGRSIGTQIHPDAAFDTWLDVALYLPKGAFTALFMPLPGLYPLEGKLGRAAAAGENALLLVIAAAALAAVVRGFPAPDRLAWLVFFGVMTTGAALFEFDLGSAGRHKLLYLPMLFPFAAESVLRPSDGEKRA